MLTFRCRPAESVSETSRAPVKPLLAASTSWARTGWVASTREVSVVADMGFSSGRSGRWCTYPRPCAESRARDPGSVEGRGGGPDEVERPAKHEECDHQRQAEGQCDRPPPGHPAQAGDGRHGDPDHQSPNLEVGEPAGVSPPGRVLGPGPRDSEVQTHDGRDGPYGPPGDGGAVRDDRRGQLLGAGHG